MYMYVHVIWSIWDSDTSSLGFLLFSVMSMHVKQ